MTPYDEYLDRILARYDAYNIDDVYDRRLAVKPLWDYCQSLLLEIGVRYCGINRGALKNYHLKTRWDMIKPVLSVVDDPSVWDQFINTIQNQRSKVEHDDYSTPAKNALEYIRTNVEEFKEWCLKTGESFYRDSMGYDLVSFLKIQIHIYHGRASYIIDHCDQNPPYYMRTDYISPYEDPPFDKFKADTKYILERWRVIKDIKDLTREDIEKFINVIKNVENFNAKESMLLEQSICPFCGARIGETQTEHGGGIDGPPSAVIYRVGCVNCRYELHSETIDL